MAKRLTASESSESFKQVSKCEILERRHFTKGDVGMTNQRRRDVLPCESLENQRELPFPPAGVVGINPAIHPRQTESCVYSDSFVNIYSNIIHCSPKLGNSAVHQLVNGYTNVLGPWGRWSTIQQLKAELVTDSCNKVHGFKDMPSGRSQAYRTT